MLHASPPAHRRLAGGFTLIETFVALTILITAIAGPLTIAAQGLNSALVANDQVTASYLAQDAVEYIRWVRDSNRLSGASWLGGLDHCISADGSHACYLDSTLPSGGSNMRACPSGSCPALSYDSTSGFYNYSPGILNTAVTQSTNAPSKFSRTVAITSPIDGNTSQAAIAVTILWQDHSISHSFTVRSNIFDWQ